MKHTSYVAALLFFVGPLACSNGMSTGTSAASIESCFNTGGGHMRCVATPGGATQEPRDVDNDGKPDTFVCAIHPKKSKDAADSEKDGKATEREDGGFSSDKMDREQEDECSKMGCRDLRNHGTDKDAQEGKESSNDERHGGQETKRDGAAGKPSGDKADDAGTGTNEGHEAEHGDHRGDDMTCAPAGAGDGGSTSKVTDGGSASTPAG